MSDLPPLLDAQDVGISFDTDGVERPTVHLDVAAYPAIADLARVHAVEGIGDVRTRARRIDEPEGSRLLLGITMRRPVRAAFAIAFELPTHAAFLDAVARSGQLTLATTDPEAAITDAPLWLSVDIDGPALRRVSAGR